MVMGTPMRAGTTLENTMTTDPGGRPEPAPVVSASRVSATSTYPFSALVGVDDLRLALCLNAVNPEIGGVLVRGEKGTAKSTAVRGLAAVLPDVEVVSGDPYSHDPASPDAPTGAVTSRPVRIVELPVGATEDRLTGSLDLERALSEGAAAFEPGLLAAAHRGILYVDEVNLLGDHLVDVLLDSAAMGVNRVEREGVSVVHPARFQLIGTMNPEEGELRPQLLDRFGLSVTVSASRDPEERAEVVRRRLAYDADPIGFSQPWQQTQCDLAARIVRARELVHEVTLSDQQLDNIVALCAHFDVDGLRADLVCARTAMTVAAWEGRHAVTLEDVRTAARLALGHRKRRGPFEEPGIDEQELDEAMQDMEDDMPHTPDVIPPNQQPQAPEHEEQLPPPPAQEQPGKAEGEPPASPPQTDAGMPEATPDTEDAPEGPSTPREEEVLAVGQTFVPLAIRLAGRGVGDWGRRSPAIGDRGRIIGNQTQVNHDLALVPTLRRAVIRTSGSGRTDQRPVDRVNPEDWRSNIRQGREGNLVLFCVDASGSMAAKSRMEAVKGAVLSLLTDAYQRRDRIGMIGFRGHDAKVIVPPTTSVDLAAGQLTDLPTGGRTPLVVGLEKAAQVLEAEKIRDSRRRQLLVIISDGRATWPKTGGVAAAMHAAKGLAGMKVPALVIDTEQGHVRLGLAKQLADTLGAAYVPLDTLTSGGLREMIIGATAPARIR